nr:Wzy polymerase domain-containing protein [uncultured Rhodoferax sp.]
MAWPRLALFLLVLSVTPLLQWAAGQIHSVGTAWMVCLYLLGLALAVAMGSHLQQRRAWVLADALFLAIAVAAMVSLSVQLCQWSGQSGDGYCGANWMVVHGGNSRFYANLNQPNQLASLLVWGLLACAWSWQRGRLHPGLALALALALVLGLALTGSRTALLGYTLLCVLAWYWRRLWPKPGLLRAAFGLWVIYLLLLCFWPLADSTVGSEGARVIARTASEPRPQVWGMFLQSLEFRPWMGYGWNQSLEAQMTVLSHAPQDDTLHGALYGQAHNLFVDLLVWLGLPLGLMLIGLVLLWTWRSWRNTATAEDALVLSAVLYMGLHAMLELPLYYAYFLLPTGLWVGMLEARRQKKMALHYGGLLLGVGVALSATLFVLTVRDYLDVEESFAELRLERAHVLSSVPRTAPKVLLLTQLRDTIVLARLPLDDAISDARLAWVRGIAMTYPTPENLRIMARALELRGAQDEARTWRRVRCLQIGPSCTP